MVEKFDIYEDIANRCNGDIYLGIVGPVRVGKSSFITNFMQQAVMPKLAENSSKKRIKDELPQAGSGKTIMTTQPKFVPNDAVNINVGESGRAKVRLIDCVGFMVDGIDGDNSEKRMVKTPWSDKEIPFNDAAEIGTRRVIEEHSTVGIMLTTDGSFGEIPRESYVTAEEKVVDSLKKSKKPFIVLINSGEPESPACKKLQASLAKKYGVPVLCQNVIKMSVSDFSNVLKALLFEFEATRIDIDLPSWMQALPADSEIIQKVIDAISKKMDKVNKLNDYVLVEEAFKDSDVVSPPVVTANLGNGVILAKCEGAAGFFYKYLSAECGGEILDEFDLIVNLKELISSKNAYDKLKNAINDANTTGYGVVMPNLNELELATPEIVKDGSKFGLNLKATAPCLHIVKVDIESEVNPIMGNELQSEELVKYLLKEFESNPKGIWNTNMFGKPLNQIVSDSLNTKIAAMPTEVKGKIRKTITRIINDGKGGVICILL